MLSAQLHYIPKESDSAKIIMPHGFIGFDDYKHFTIAPFFDDQPDNSFWVLKSLDHPNLSFVLLGLCPWHQGHITLKQEDVEACCLNLGIKIDEICVFLVVSHRLKEGEERITINVSAPLIYHTITRQAWQVILPNPEYPVALDLGENLGCYLVS